MLTYNLKFQEIDSKKKAQATVDETTVTSAFLLITYSKLCPRRESNPHFKLRRLTCYPLHHEDCNQTTEFQRTLFIILITLIESKTYFRALYLTYIDHNRYDIIRVEMESVSTKLF